MISVILGVLCILYGLYTLYLRLAKKDKVWGKLQSMKDAYGEKPGEIIHIISYTVVPLLIGIAALVFYFVFGVNVFGS